MSTPEQQPEQAKPEIHTETAGITAVNDNDAVTENPAVTEAAAEEAAETAQAPQAPQKSFLQKAFNFAVKAGIGAAVSAVLKTAAVVGTGLAGAPVWATFLISGVSVGVGATLAHDCFTRRDLRRQGAALAPYFSKAHAKQLVSKENLKVFGISTAAALVGSALYLGFHDGLIQHGWSQLTGPAPAATPPVHPAVVAPVQAVTATPVAPAQHAVVAPVVAATPVHHAVAPAIVPVHCASPVQQFAELIKGHHVSAAVRDALHRAASSNAHVQAQGVKDLGYYTQNGFGGVPENHNVALQLFKQAADAGNVQAKVDMLYLQHYGLDGITADKTSSLEAMKGIAHNARASAFAKAWGGAGKAVHAIKFSSDAIVKGVKFACPA